LFVSAFIKLASALEVEMWEMFDFGHIASHKELKEAIQKIARSADETTLRLALKVIRVLTSLPFVVNYCLYNMIKLKI